MGKSNVLEFQGREQIADPLTELLHFHMLFLDGVYVDDAAGSCARFRWVKAPTSTELAQLTHTIAHRVSRFLERQDLLVRDDESAYLSLDTGSDDPMDALIGHSITYHIATGPRQGRKVLTLQSLPAIDESFTTRAGNVAGFSLHAGVATKARERDKLERLCRYITRPALSEIRLSLTEHGNVRYTLKNPWRDGTTHVIFEPLDFIARLAALVPKPRGISHPISWPVSPHCFWSVFLWINILCN